jgi:hypothetical protein
MVVMSFLAGLVFAISSLTSVSPPSSCTAWQFVRVATSMVRLVFDTMLSFDGLLIFLISCIAVILFASPLLTIVLGSTLITAALTVYKMHEAHSAFVALGPGLALPFSGSGFRRMVQIALGKLDANGNGFLQQMSLRKGPSPYTVGTTVQEQISQQPPEDVQQYFADRLALFAMQPGDNDITSISGTTTSVLASPCDCVPNPNLRTFGCSTCCPQRSNCGVHAILHPSDFEEVIRTGHGEMHPLASTDSPFSRSRGNPCLPSTLTLVYTPREYSEVCTVMRIIEAEAKYVASIDGEAI